MTMQLLQELFEAKASQQPQHLAVDALNKQLSYLELNEASQSLANRILDFDIKSRPLIVIAMEKGWEQVVAVLAVLKAGFAFLPIDPDESIERLQYLLDISDANIILTQKKYFEHLSVLGHILIPVDATLFSQHVLPKQPIKKVKPSDLAYVIFTSGSTGTPKGVMMSHESVVNTLLDINERFAVNSDDKIFALSNLTFDLAIYDIFGILAAGGVIVLPNAKHVKDPIAWKDIFFEKEITIWNSVPALMDLFVEYLKQRNCDTKTHPLRLVLMSGDWIPLNLPGKIKKLFKNIQVISLGGATEAAIWSILYPIQNVNPSWKSIPYGRAMKNQSFHILDDNLQPIEYGETGELCIGGVGVAQGYWKAPDLTDAKFVNHLEYGKLYRTGDLGAYMPDGDIEFLGRKDFQVKISGHRVEIGGVEKNILDFSHVKQAIVLTINEAHKQQLVAYLNFDYKELLGEKNLKNIEESEQIEHWQKIYNVLFKDNESIIEKTFNIAGWIDSHNQPIPKEQMVEWTNNITARVLSLNPKNVLEIGVGSGLIFFRVVNSVIHYDATDFSNSAIEYVSKQITRLKISNAHLIKCAAHEVGQLKNAYDTVILSSVVQYFPSFEYLENVIEQSIEKIKDKGQVIISDVRSLEHLPAHHVALLLHKNINHLTFSEFKNVLDKSIEDEDELVISAAYFYMLRDKYPRVTHVEILHKEGSFHNEMNCFRYDVILHVNHKYTRVMDDIKWIDYVGQDFCIALNGCEIIAIKNIPNKRTAGLSYVINKDLSQFSNGWFDFFKSQYRKAQEASIDPSKLCLLAKENGYHAIITHSFDHVMDCFNVVFVKLQDLDKFRGDYLHLIESSSSLLKTKLQGKYTNFPLLPRVNRKLIAELKEFLKKRLPQYAIPSYFVAMSSIPLAANGKINRQLLPYIIEPLNNLSITPATTEIQKKLMTAWEEILGVRSFGIYENFYDLGGSSLLFVELSLMVEKLFDITLNFNDMKQCQLNIHNLSLFVEKQTIKDTCPL
jgi:amino acid adenylation domain-containing protein